MASKEEILKWGQGERVASLPQNKLPGTTTKVESSTIGERKSAEKMKRMESLRAAHDKKKGRIDLVTAIQTDVPREKITLIVSKDSREGDAILNFGRENGKRLSEVPRDYLAWMKRDFLTEKNVRPLLQSLVEHILSGDDFNPPEEFVPRTWKKEETSHTGVERGVGHAIALSRLSKEDSISAVLGALAPLLKPFGAEIEAKLESSSEVLTVNVYDARDEHVAVPFIRVPIKTPVDAIRSLEDGLKAHLATHGIEVNLVHDSDRGTIAISTKVVPVVKAR